MVDDVVRMLEQGVEPAVIEDWVDVQPAGPGPLSPDDLIRLSKAGAPDALVQRLLARSKTPPAREAAPVAAQRLAAPEGRVPVRFVIRYEPYASFDMDDQDPLSLYVYLDGRLLASSGSQTGWFGDAALRIDPSITPGRTEGWLAPGAHEIRLMREYHGSRGRGDRKVWHHEAEVCPDVIEFEVAAGHEWDLELSWTEPNFSSTRTPLTWRLSKDGEPVAGLEDGGTPRNEWPPLCEDLELRAAAKDKIPREIRRALDECVRWAGLWRDFVDAPPRRQLLAELEAPRPAE